MNNRLIYWTLNNKQEAFFLDSDGRCRSLLKDGKAMIGREDAASYLSEQRPHHKIIWLESPEQLHRIAVEMKWGERDLDARPLTQIATAVRSNTPPWNPLHKQAQHVIALAEQYEQGQINQSHVLDKLREPSEQASQTQHFTLFLYQLAESQLD